MNSQYLLFLDGGTINFQARSASTGLSTAHGAAIAVGSWSHVDGTTLRLYVNGASQSDPNSSNNTLGFSTLVN